MQKTINHPPKQLAITVLIATKDEEQNIRECLESIQWAEQILVIGSDSSDQTEAITKEFDAEFHLFKYKGGWPKKRNWALKSGLIRNPWVLILDADERVSTELRDDIQNAIKDPSFNGYYLQWKFVFLGKWMKHSWSHGWMMRFFRSNKGEYENLNMTDEGGWDAEVQVR